MKIPLLTRNADAPELREIAAENPHPLEILSAEERSRWSGKVIAIAVDPTSTAFGRVIASGDNASEVAAAAAAYSAKSPVRWSICRVLPAAELQQCELPPAQV